MKECSGPCLSDDEINKLINEYSEEGKVYKINLG